MTLFVLRRLGVAVPVLIGVTLLVFSILQLIPGDPAQILLVGSNPTPQAVANLRQQLGLNQGFALQYLHYLSRLVSGNLGYSYVSQQTVAYEISQHLAYTINLTIGGLVVAVGLGLPLGMIAGLRPHGLVDKLATGVAVFGIAIPYFWLAILLVLIFSVKLGLLPSLGTGSPQAIILPAISLGWGFAAIIARLLRNSLIDTYQRPFMLVARAKGLSGRQLLFRHALRNGISSTSATCWRARLLWRSFSAGRGSGAFWSPASRRRTSRRSRVLSCS
jgi:peptide/nickel transport system permease protein